MLYYFFRDWLYEIWCLLIGKYQSMVGLFNEWLSNLMLPWKESRAAGDRNCILHEHVNVTQALWLEKVQCSHALIGTIMQKNQWQWQENRHWSKFHETRNLLGLSSEFLLTKQRSGILSQWDKIKWNLANQVFSLYILNSLLTFEAFGISGFNISVQNHVFF